MLFGLCSLGQGVHVEPLRNQHFDDRKCLQDAERIATQQAGFSPAYSKSLLAMEHTAQEIAEKSNHSWIGTEQIALALLRADDEIGVLLRNSYKLDAKKLEADILKELDPSLK